MSIGIFNEVWHRIWPLEPRAYEHFVRYYGEHVVGPNKDLLDALGGFKYLDGDSNSDTTLYRYASIPAIEATFAAFGQDPGYVAATQALAEAVEIEENRTLAFPLPCSTPERLEAVLDEEPANPRLYVQIRRLLPMLERLEAGQMIGQLADEVEKAGAARLVSAYEPIFGDVTKSTELWVLPEGIREFELEAAASSQTLGELQKLAPEAWRRRLEPLPYSRLR